MSSRPSQGFQDRLIEFLCSVKALEDYDNRDTLLRGMPRSLEGQIRRTTAYAVDLRKIVETVAFGGRLVSGQHALELLMDNVHIFIEGLVEKEQELQKLKEEFASLISSLNNKRTPTTPSVSRSSEEPLTHKEEPTEEKNAHPSAPDQPVESSPTLIPRRTWVLLVAMGLVFFLLAFWGWCLFGDQPNLVAYLQTVFTIIGVPVAILAIIFVMRRPIVLEDVLYRLGTKRQWTYLLPTCVLVL